MTENSQSSVRLRFAPSPTGYLHVGGARTALYNWLIARKKNGTFLLRIEDTDVKRSSQEMVDVILNSLAWLGLNWDEGPYYQSQHIDMYRQAAIRLLAEKKAYPCFCKPEEINARREAGMKAQGSWKYERLCLQLAQESIEEKLQAGQPYAVRFLVPPSETSFVDLIYKEIRVDNNSIEDFVLLRSDGHPTYHLCVVVDDIDMRITHVIRGADHISNTPKQLLLYSALGRTPPQFGHLPLILGPDKKRLSKRHGSVAVEEYRNQGILPEALLNFLALLGWNPGDEREIFSKEELVKEFDLDRVNSSNAVFDLKKLQWMNGKYLSSVKLERILELIVPYLEDPAWSKEPDFPKLIDLMRTRAVSLIELADMIVPFYREDFLYDTGALEKFRKDPAIVKYLQEFTSVLQGVTDWNKQSLESQLREFAEKHGIKPALLIHPIRLALTGKTGGPGIFEVLELMGKEKTMARLQRFLQACSSAL